LLRALVRHGAGTLCGSPAPCRSLRVTEKDRCTLPRVLVVEEQASHARVTAIGLRLEGFDVETASTSVEALELLAAQGFDIAIVDLMLPGTNGIQLARLVRERHPGTRVVLTSAYHVSERQLSRADCGAAGFVPKPLDLGELAQFLRSKVASAFDAPGTGVDGLGPPRAHPVAGDAVSR
jgi:DNA-binding response OmpR family regulator